MQILQRSRGISSSRCRLAESLAKDICQFNGFAIFDWINKNPSPGPFRNHIDAVEPTLCIGPRRFAVTDDQELIDARQGDEFRGKALGLRRRGGK